MHQLEKFMFNRSFDDNSVAEAEEAAAAEALEEDEQEEEVITFTEEQLEAARREGFDAGKEEGIREAGDAMETRISDTLATLDAEFQKLFNGQITANAEFFDDAVNIAIAVSRKCFPHLSETDAPRVIENMVRGALAEILEEPRVIIHVHADLVEDLNARIGDVAEAANFEGQILILEDQGMASGDCRVTWSSGSAERDMGALWQQIDEIVEHNLHAVKQNLKGSKNESTGDIGASGESQDDTMATNEASAADPAPLSAEQTTTDDIAASTSPSASDTAILEDEQSLDINDLDTQQPPQSDEGLINADTIDTPPEADSPNDSTDDTETHLQAGPGIVEQPSDEAILELEQSSGEVEDETTEDLPRAGSD